MKLAVSSHPIRLTSLAVGNRSVPGPGGHNSCGYAAERPGASPGSAHLERTKAMASTLVSRVRRVRPGRR